MTTSSLLFGAGLALLAIWFVARPFRGGHLQGDFGRAHSQRERLLRQKAALLAAIREIDADVQVGKLEPSDHRVLRQRYAAEAVAVLKSLDALPIDDAVDAAIEADVTRVRQGERLDAPSVRSCARCGASMELHDRFCARCGARLGD